MPLLYVLWIVALLTIIAAATHTSGTVSYTLTRNTADIARQEALAEAALNLAVLSLLDKRPDKRPRGDGAPRKLVFEDAEIGVSIQDELGRIDLNAADAPLLAGLFRAAGTPAQEADTIADRIIDWRDSDDLRRLNGAEKADYHRADLSAWPRNAPFQSVDELKLVSGMTVGLFRRVEPVLTVYSGKPTIDPRVAPSLGRQALFGGTRSVHLSSPNAAPINPAVSLNGRAFVVRIDLRSRQSPVSYEAVIRLTGNPQAPYWLMKWKRRWAPSH